MAPTGQASTRVRLRLRRSGKRGKRKTVNGLEVVPLKLGDIFVSLIDFGLRRSLCFFIVLGSLQSTVQAFSFLRLTSNFKEAFKYCAGRCVSVC